MNSLAWSIPSIRWSRTLPGWGFDGEDRGERGGRFAQAGCYGLSYSAVDAAGNAAIEMVGTVEVMASGVNIAIRIEQIVPESFGFSFESQKGKDYVVEFSEDLRNWGKLKTYNGTGTLIQFGDERDQVFRKSTTG